jgi:putative oxidoreductase
MKIAILIARILLGLIFVVFGANGLHPFLPMMGPLPTGLAAQFLTVFLQSHWVMFVAAVQFVSGLLLLVNRYVPLALAMLGPVIVNIILYHVLLSSAGAALAVVAIVLWVFLFYTYRQYFSGIFVQKTV